MEALLEEINFGLIESKCVGLGDRDTWGELVVGATVEVLESGDTALTVDDSNRGRGLSRRGDGNDWRGGIPGPTINDGETGDLACCGIENSGYLSGRSTRRSGDRNRRCARVEGASIGEFHICYFPVEDGSGGKSPITRSIENDDRR